MNRFRYFYDVVKKNYKKHQIFFSNIQNKTKETLKKNSKEF